MNQKISGKTLDVSVNGRQISSTILTNALVEAGVLHGRALLEFLGIGLKKNTLQLQNVAHRRPSDIGIEQLYDGQRGLSQLDIPSALAAYSGESAEAELALAVFLKASNKLLAHVTRHDLEEFAGNHLVIATKAIPVLVHNALYSKLGMEMPRTARMAG